MITNNISTTQFYNIDNYITDGSFEHRKPTINERLDYIHISLDQVRNHTKNCPTGQTNNVDVEPLKSRIDHIEWTSDNQNKQSLT